MIFDHAYEEALDWWRSAKNLCAECDQPDVRHSSVWAPDEPQS